MTTTSTNITTSLATNTTDQLTNTTTNINISIAITTTYTLQTAALGQIQVPDIDFQECHLIIPPRQQVSPMTAQNRWIKGRVGTTTEGVLLILLTRGAIRISTECQVSGLWVDRCESYFQTPALPSRGLHTQRSAFTLFVFPLL